MSYKKAKATKSTKKPPTAAKTRTRRILGRVGTGVVALVSFVAAGVTLLPRVTATVSDPVAPEDPFSSSVTITNTGYIFLRSVDASVAVKNVTTLEHGKQISITGSPDFKSRFRRTQWYPQTLGLDDHFTFAINDLLGAYKEPLISADLAIVVKYYTPIFPIAGEKIFPIYARKQSNGNFYWYARAPPN